MANQFTKCMKCLKNVYENTNSICCDKCDNWFHLRCSKLKLKEFKKFTKNQNLNYICYYCFNYPCPKCTKPVFDHHNGICCDCCGKWLHLKCTKLNKESYFNIHKNIWFCSFCFEFPFSSVNNDDLLDNLAIDKFVEQNTLKPDVYAIAKLVLYAGKHLGKSSIN